MEQNVRGGVVKMQPRGAKMRHPEFRYFSHFFVLQRKYKESINQTTLTNNQLLGRGIRE